MALERFISDSQRFFFDTQRNIKRLLVMNSPTLEMVFWDVQHGSATYIKTPNETHIVQDLGTGSYGRGRADFSPLLHLKREYGVHRLDYAIFTHPHKDHISDIMNFDKLTPRVLHRPKHLNKDDVMVNIREEDRHLFEKYFEINKRYSSPVSEDRDPELPQNNGGVEIQTFIPTSCGRSNINNHSIVTVVSYAQIKIILPGDNEPPSWKELLEFESFVKTIDDADILLAPHHGRKSGFYPDLFDYFTPYLTIISDGSVCDTSAVDRYSKVSEGWTVHHRSGKASEERYCVTTRKDGFIVVKVGYTEEKKRFIDVRID